MKTQDSGLVQVYMDLPEFNIEQFNSGLKRYFHLEGKLKDHYYSNGTYFDETIVAFYPEHLKGIKDKVGLIKSLKDEEKD